MSQEPPEFREDPDDVYWRRRAAGWHRVGPPWRPDDEALAAYRALGAAGAGRVLLLGLTPELCALVGRGPLVAADRCRPMIEALWRPAGPEAAVLLAEWSRLPLEDGGMDRALADGCVNAMPSLEALHRVAAELHRVLRPGGALLTRIFLRDPSPPAPEDLVAALRGGAFQSPERFRMRLTASLQRDPREGVLMAELWERWRALVPDPPALARALRWPAGAFDNLEDARGCPGRLLFASRAELDGLLEPWFALERVLVPSDDHAVARYRRQDLPGFEPTNIHREVGRSTR